jgi:hypothetical protein
MLEMIEILHGTFNLIVVIINLIIGVRIASKYFKYKQINLLLVGIAWIGLGSIYLPSSVKFLMIILMNYYISDTVAFILNHAFLPPFTLCWLIAITSLLNVNVLTRKLLIGGFCIISIILETTFFLFIFTRNLEGIGEFTGVFTIEWTVFSIIYLLFFALIVLLTGILFARESLKSENPEINLKGKFLLAAFISFIIGAFFEVIFPLSYISIIITRLILVSSSIEFYLGLLLPEWAKKIFLEKK